MLLDVVTVQADQRAEGDELPSYQDLYADVPCKIVTISGQETWRGRQLEQSINYVVQMAYDFGMDLQPEQRLVVVDSTILPAGSVVNVVHANPERKVGQRPMWEVYCKSG